MQPFLTSDEEQEIVRWIEEMAEAGLPINEGILRISVGQFVKRLGKQGLFRADIPSRGWVAKFLRRHPEISKRTANQLCKRRTVTEIEVRAWFTEVNDSLADSDFQHVIDHPDRVFNMDESSFEMAPNPKKGRLWRKKA